MADEPFDVVVPLELEAGAHAERLAGWITPHAFVLDFLARTEDQQLVTARVRIPATAALDLVGELEALIRDYELLYGEIHRPRQRGDE
jgi:hypothetical protein